MARFIPLKSMILFFGLMFISSTAWADKVYVAVAANFTAPAKEIAEAFEQETGHQAVLSFGSTGKLYIQIINGAPYGVFLAADAARPERLEQEGVAVLGSRFTYAKGKIVLYSRDDDLIQGSPDVLGQEAAFQKLAIANPKTAPYGFAAIETLKHLSVYEQNKDKLVKGDNIAQAYQFVFTQNAQVGFVALSQVINEAKGSRWIVPQDFYSPIRQQAVLLKQDADNPAAQAFVTFLSADGARAIIKRFGYGN
ncbi:MAG: molybdate ABC transporter substrate-binding protein [Methylocystaceae bacterium]|nr:molybdate ABC transporter substrate-binding protein [Methylocystaceae bacterium]